MSTSREIYRELFLNVFNNQLNEFIKTLKSHPELDLTTTDDCHPALEKELGGDWFEHQGRAENNTLLNLALSMNRLEHAEYLIRLNKENKRDIGINKSNKHEIYPLDMAFMIHVGDDKKEDKIEKWRNILFYLWDDKSSDAIRFSERGAVLSPIQQLSHLPPRFAYDLLKRCEHYLKDNEKASFILQGIQLYFTDNPNQKANIEFIQLLKDDSTFKDLLKKAVTEPANKNVKTPFIFNIVDAIKSQQASPVELLLELNFIPGIMDWKNSIGKLLRSKLSEEEAKKVDSGMSQNQQVKIELRGKTI